MGAEKQVRRPPNGRGASVGGRSGSSGASPDYGPAADRLVAEMDRLGIARAIVLPPPQSPENEGSVRRRDLLAAVRRHPDRLALGAGGDDLNVMIHRIDSAAVTPADRAEFVRRADEIVRDGARVFGEMSILHFALGPGHPFEQVPADHPLLLLLAEISARTGVPIDVHWEAVSEEIPTPSALRDRNAANPPRIAETVPGLERLLAHDRRAKVVLVHAGWDNTGEQTPALLRRLLSAHPNLICALKQVRREDEPFRRGNEMADGDGRVRPEWTALIADFPDRFVVGADEFVQAGTAGGRRRGPPSFEETWSAVRRLPSDLLERVGGENAVRIYGL